MFPTRVNLTTITLYYYSDNDWGFPRLRFFAVPDDFNIWEAPTLNVEVDAVSPGGEPVGMLVSIILTLPRRRCLWSSWVASSALQWVRWNFYTCFSKFQLFIFLYAHQRNHNYTYYIHCSCSDHYGPTYTCDNSPSTNVICPLLWSSMKKRHLPQLSLSHPPLLLVQDNHLTPFNQWWIDLIMQPRRDFWVWGKF